MMTELSRYSSLLLFKALNYKFLMILVWNCRGFSSQIFVCICRSFVDLLKLKILILVENWIGGENAKNSIRKLGFSFSVRENLVGLSKGILGSLK